MQRIKDLRKAQHGEILKGSKSLNQKIQEERPLWDRLLVARLSSSELKASLFARGSSSISLVFFNNWANLVLRAQYKKQHSFISTDYTKLPHYYNSTTEHMLNFLCIRKVPVSNKARQYSLQYFLTYQDNKEPQQEHYEQRPTLLAKQQQPHVIAENPQSCFSSFFHCKNKETYKLLAGTLNRVTRSTPSENHKGYLQDPFSGADGNFLSNKHLQRQIKHITTGYVCGESECIEKINLDLKADELEQKDPGNM
ncbi:hypothetical protein Anapl_01442 [Anas platyrhynchos]|uniref:Uncharacterized protein n=1 Tax=Anas platyrhynchos TaxID=8839 RepID=R0LRX1_ANAPL|nr:hypothetical protein Anapl_01442 [Anas platyrhynchos]